VRTTDETKHLVVIGLGYVGLPLARSASKAGIRVTGLDLNKTVINSLNTGKSHIGDVSDNDVGFMKANGFLATDDETCMATADVIVICVPTPLDGVGLPDLRSVNSATASVAKNISHGALVILESTTYPGTTEEAVMPVLAGGSKICGEDFYLAFSPERIDPGNKTFEITNTPKVVGGVTGNCADKAASFYRRFVREVIIAKGTREAEMAKLLENTYRHVNIALVNELAQFCHEMKIDIWDVIRCASSKPFGYQAFYPSAGVGGHCIPIDPNYLAYKVRADLGHPFRFVHLAEEINQAMPSYVVRRVQEILNESKKALNGARVLLMGVTYKPNIGDTRETPAEDVARGLLKAGSDVSYSDPYVNAWTVGGTDVPAIKYQSVDIKNFDVIVVLQFHKEFRSWFQSMHDFEIDVLDTTGTLDPSFAQRL